MKKSFVAIFISVSVALFIISIIISAQPIIKNLDYASYGPNNSIEKINFSSDGNAYYYSRDENGRAHS